MHIASSHLDVYGLCSFQEGFFYLRHAAFLTPGPQRGSQKCVKLRPDHPISSKEEEKQQLLNHGLSKKGPTANGTGSYFWI